MTDWTKSQGSGTDWTGGGRSSSKWGGGAPANAEGKKDDGGGVLGAIGGGLSAAAGALKGIGVGVAGTALDIVRSPYVMIDETTSGRSEEERKESYNKRLKFLAGLAWGGEEGGGGLAQTGRLVGVKVPGPVGESTVAPSEAYGKDPFGAALNDVSNVAMVAGPVAGVAGKATAGAQAGTTAAKINTAARVTDTAINPLSWPFRGGRAGLSKIGTKAIAEGVEDLGPLQKVGVKMTPEYQALKNAVLEGRAQENAVRDVIRHAGTDEAAVEGLRKAGMRKVAATVEKAAAEAAKKSEPLNTERVALGAVRAETSSKLGHLDSAVLGPADDGRMSIKEMTQGQFGGEASFPTGLAEQVRPYFTMPNQTSTSGALSLLDVPNRLYYAGRLALSPGPLVNNTAGNVALSLSSNNPAGVLKNLGRLATRRVKPAELEGMPLRVGRGAALPAESVEQAADSAKRGINAKTADALARLSAKSPIMKVARKMDDTIRKAAYLTEKQGGASTEEAARHVFRAFGEFDALKPLERDVLRRFVPFYNWHKQIAMIVSHMAEDNPARVQLMAHLGQIAGDVNEAEGLPEGGVPVGKHLMDPGFIVPFGEVGTTLKGGGAPMLGPIPKALYGLGSGDNPNTGRAFSGPLSKSGVDYRNAGVLMNLRKAMPHVNLMDAFTGRSKVVRYNSGDPVLIQGKPIETKGNWIDALLSFGGLRSENLEAGKDRQAAIDEARGKKAKTQATQDARYKAALKAAGL